MHALCHARSFEIKDQFFCLGSVFCGIDQFHFSRSRNFHLGIFIYITVCMSCDGDWFFPVLYARFDAFYNNRSTEYGSVEDRTDGSIRAFPHFFQIVLGHTCSVWSDGSTFDCNTVFLGCHGCIDGYLIVGFVSVFQTQIVVFGFQVDVGKQQIIFDHLPQNSCHLVSVHLYQWCCHLNFTHFLSPPVYSFILFCFLSFEPFEVSGFSLLQILLVSFSADPGFRLHAEYVRLPAAPPDLHLVL